MLLLRDMLYSLVRMSSALGPRCFRCLMLMSSGPVELLFFICLIAVVVCSIVIVIR